MIPNGKLLSIRNTNKEEFYTYVDSLGTNVDGVDDVDVVESKIFKNDHNLVLNGKLCISVRFDNLVNSIVIYIEKHDDQLEILLNIWNYTVSNYLVDILEDEF